MSKIPTAKEICSKQFFGFKGELWTGVHQAMIEFAKLHVKAALKEASENAYCDLEHPNEDNDLEESEVIVIKSSILNAYQLENIK